MLGTVFLAAAAGKVMDPVRFGQVVGFVATGSPGRDSVSWSLALGVIGWEAFLGVLLIGNGAGVRALLATLATLIVFSAVLGTLAMREGAPGCGCLSLLRFGGDAADDARMGLGRNAGMAWIVGWLLLRARRRKEGRPDVDRGWSRRGFTLVEVLVVLTVLALLLALILPVLASSRNQARVARTLTARDTCRTLRLRETRMARRCSAVSTFPGTTSLRRGCTG
jgi:prepilin-type N-terminal cleavage/methylation domain-containing protein